MFRITDKIRREIQDFSRLLTGNLKMRIRTRRHFVREKGFPECLKFWKPPRAGLLITVDFIDESGEPIMELERIPFFDGDTLIINDLFFDANITIDGSLAN